MNTKRPAGAKKVGDSSERVQTSALAYPSGAYSADAGGGVVAGANTSTWVRASRPPVAPGDEDFGMGQLRLDDSVSMDGHGCRGVVVGRFESGRSIFGDRDGGDSQGFGGSRGGDREGNC